MKSQTTKKPITIKEFPKFTSFDCIYFHCEYRRNDTDWVLNFFTQENREWPPNFPKTVEDVFKRHLSITQDVRAKFYNIAVRQDAPASHIALPIDYADIMINGKYKRVKLLRPENFKPDKNGGEIVLNIVIKGRGYDLFFEETVKKILYDLAREFEKTAREKK